MTQVLAAIRLEMLEAREGAEAEVQRAQAEVQRAQKLVIEAREGAEAEVQRAQAEMQRAQAEVQRAQAEMQRAQAEMQRAQAEMQLARDEAIDEAVASVRRETHTAYCKAKLKWEEQTQAAERSFAAALDEVRAQLGAEREASAAHADGQLSAVLDPLRADLEQVR
jgi:seryl-tRNA synthetase